MFVMVSPVVTVGASKFASASTGGRTSPFLALSSLGNNSHRYLTNVITRDLPQRKKVAIAPKYPRQLFPAQDSSTF